MEKNSYSIQVARKAPNWPAMVSPIDHRSILPIRQISPSRQVSPIRQIKTVDPIIHRSVENKAAAMWFQNRFSSEDSEYSRATTSHGGGRLMRQCDICKVLYKSFHTCSARKLHTAQSSRQNLKHIVKYEASLEPL